MFNLVLKDDRECRWTYRYVVSKILFEPFKKNKFYNCPL